MAASSTPDGRLVVAIRQDAVHHIAWGTARAARDQMDQNPAVEAANMYDYHWDVLPKTIWYLYIYMTLAYCDTYHGIYIIY